MSRASFQDLAAPRIGPPSRADLGDIHPREWTERAFPHLNCLLIRTIPSLDALGLVQLRAGASLIDLITVSSPLGGPGPGTGARNVGHFALQLEHFDDPRIREQLAAFGVEAADGR